MPLPTDRSTSWPPKDHAHLFTEMHRHKAWYQGTPDGLATAYGAYTGPRVINHPTQYRGGVVGAVSRFFWGRPVAEQRRTGLHVPIAADLAKASADLLYADPPKVTSEHEPTAARLESYMDDGMVTTLSAGAEVGAALGGRYHRVTWDPSVDRPFLSTVNADKAIPTFRWGRLVAVTFWTVVARNGSMVVRHLERHELDGSGNGLVFHGLYEGDGQTLGQVVPLADHDSTRHLADQVGPDGAITAGRTPGLCVEYVPNATPNAAWMDEPVGQYLGESDFAKVEPLMDALDEVYSSWMRDVRIAKGRLIVPTAYLKAGKPGEGASFDLDDEVITPLDIPLPEDGQSSITPQQFAIRVAEHQQTAQQLVEDILRTAGYSASTFGEDEDGASVTATEVVARKGQSLRTRGRKVRLERPVLARLARKMLLTDQAVFSTANLDPAEAVHVDFGSATHDSPMQLAQTVETLSRAKAASTRTLVAMAHPEWADTEVDEEVALIEAKERMSDPADPALFG